MGQHSSLRRGEIKEFDLFKGDNFCRLVFGPPGMGMSYMINDLIRDVSPNPAFTKKIARKPRLLAGT